MDEAGRRGDDSSSAGEGGGDVGEQHRRQHRGDVEVDVKVRLTRRPNGRQRRRALFTKARFKNLAAPFEVPGAELAEIPVIGVVILVVIGLVLLVVVGILVGGFVIAFVELLVLASFGVVGSLWAWLRGHPRVSVADVGDQRWVKPDGPSVSVSDDERLIKRGSTPAELGYHLMG